MNQNNISYNYNDLSQPFINNHENYKEQKKDFLYSMKLRTAILGFILYLILSSSIAFKILHLIKSIFGLEVIQHIHQAVLCQEVLQSQQVVTRLLYP